MIRLFLFALAIGCIYGQLLDSPWPVAGQNTKQTRFSPYEGPASADLYWSFRANGQQYSEPVVGNDGSIYFGTVTGDVYSLSAYGTLNWNYSLSNNTKTNHQVMNSLVLSADGHVFIACEDSYLYKLSCADGKLTWKKNMGGGMMASPVIYKEASILLISTSINFQAININTGNQEWSLSQMASSYAPAIGNDGTIYLCAGFYLYKISADGVIQSKVQVTTAANINLPPVIGPNGLIYVSDGQFISAIKGTISLWAIQIPSSILGNIVVDDEGYVYLVNYGESLYCISPDGDVQYILETGSASTNFIIPFMGSNHVLYVGTKQGLLYSAHMPASSTGANFLWSYDMGTPAATSPTLLQSGVMVVAGTDNYLYAFKPANCSTGTYVTPDGATFCTPCETGYYSSDENAASCSKCTYPWTSIKEGATECTSILLLPEGSVTTTALLFTSMAVMIVVCMLHGKQRVAIFVNLVFPTLDVFSDLAYLTTNEFYNVGLFVACVISIGIPAVSFVKSLWDHKVRPSLYIKVHEALWLTAGHEHDFIYFPVFPWFANSNGGRLPLLSSTEHSTFASVVLELIAWVVAIAAQVATVVVVIPGNVLLLGGWFVLGVFLHLTKMITIGAVWNMWFQVWTQSTVYDTEVDVDTAELILCLEEEFLSETIPQFIIQLINNILLGRFTPIAAFSMAFSIVMSINSVWRHVYHRFVRTEAMALDEVPVGMLIHVECGGKDWVLLDATLKSASKSGHKHGQQVVTTARENKGSETSAVSSIKAPLLASFVEDAEVGQTDDGSSASINK